MAKQEIKISLEAPPEGWDLGTAEVRRPAAGDLYYAGVDCWLQWTSSTPGATPWLCLRKVKRVPKVGEVWRSPLGTYLIQEVWLSSEQNYRRFLGLNVKTGFTASVLNLDLALIFDAASHAGAAFLAPDLETYFREKFKQEQESSETGDVGGCDDPLCPRRGEDEDEVPF